MITSWADPESEDEDEPNSDDKNKGSDKRSHKEVTTKHSKPALSVPSTSRKQGKSSKSATLPVVFGPQLPSSLPATLGSYSSKHKIRARNGSTEENTEVESKVVIQKLRRLKTEGDVIIGTRERVPIRKSLDRSRSGSPNDHLSSSIKTKLTDTHSTQGDKTIEISLLSRLRQQVKILEDLGGCVPSDVKDLLSSVSKRPDSTPTSLADNIIAMIEMEQPPDHKPDENLLSSLKAAELRVQKAVQNIQANGIINGLDKANSASDKPSSFALIAGYGDDSDQEDVTDTSTPGPGNNKPSQERTLFPILGHEDSSKLNVTMSSATKPPNSSEGPGPSKGNSDGLPKPSLIIDPSPGQKRKKRLDIGGVHVQPLANRSISPSDSTEEPSKSSASAKSGCEVPSSATANYTTVWSSTSTYTSDPTANDRRGFGFQVIEEEANLSNRTKKGKIQFIKAETINVQQEDVSNVREGMKESDTKCKSPLFMTSLNHAQKVVINLY